MVRPMSRGFRSLPLPPALLEVVEELGFSALTPIQAASIPVLLAGTDLIGQSQTGSGKTAAFALPILARLALGSPVLSALVLCPTRELSAQVARAFRQLGRRMPGLQVRVLGGGEPIRAQQSALARGVHVAVGTPGRILDHLRRGNLHLDRVETVVLDEADRMLEMGFEQDMQTLLAALPRSRQTAFFSATFPPSIEEMSRRFQRAPERVQITSAAQDVPAVRQLLVAAEPADKQAQLCRVLAAIPHESALVFANLKASVAELARVLSRRGVSVSALHGDLEQAERDRVLAKFRNGSTRVLVATDVAARGLDVDHLDLVVNFDLPVQRETYVHRIGRTGRAGKPGLAISLAGARDARRVQELASAASAKLEPLDLSPESESVASAPAALQRDAKMDTLRIGGGRKQKVRPGDILGALTGEAGGLEGEDIGKIEIHEHFSYVAVSRRVSRRAQQSLSTGRIKGRRFVACLLK